MRASLALEAPPLLLDEAARREPEELARLLVDRAVAPDAAVGWAVRTARGWERSHAFACRDGLRAEPIFDLASLTKPMTALAVARGERLRRATLLGEVLEEARGVAAEECPVELLLAHRAGLEAHLRVDEPLVESGPRGGPGEPIDRAAALRRMASARRADAIGPLPAEGFAPVYSDLGYVLVGEALARVEGARDGGEAVEQLVLRALGREDLGTARLLSSRRSLDFAARVRPTEVVAWRGGEVRGVVHDENAWAIAGEGGAGHAGMFGTIEAVLAFGCAALDAIERGEGPLARGDLSWLVRPRPGGTLCAGFDRKSERGSSAGERAGPRTFGHLGFTGTSVWIDPDAEAVVSILTNRVSPTRESVAIRHARPVVHDALFALAAERRRGRGP